MESFPRAPSTSVFLTLRLAKPNTVSLVSHVDALRTAYLKVQLHHPMRCDAMVVLHDHLHAVWSLPRSDSDIAHRVGMLKSRFSRAVPDAPPSPSFDRLRTGERGIWARGYQTRPIETVTHMSLAMRWCWENPVRHGLCQRMEEWPYSSLHRDIRLGRVTLPQRVGTGGKSALDPQHHPAE